MGSAEAGKTGLTWTTGYDDYSVCKFLPTHTLTHTHRTYVQAMRVLIIDEIHLLGDERGPVLEVIVSRTNFISSHTQYKVHVCWILIAQSYFWLYSTLAIDMYDIISVM